MFTDILWAKMNVIMLKEVLFRESPGGGDINTHTHTHTHSNLCVCVCVCVCVQFLQ